MQPLSTAVETLDSACADYTLALKKSLEINTKLRETASNLSKALGEMKQFCGSSKCGVCYTRDIISALDPCKHCLCGRCAQRALTANKCPFCRGHVAEYCRIYI